MSTEIAASSATPIVGWTADAVLAQTRTLAGELDPDRAAVYHSMPPSRWVQALDLGAELLTGHAAYRHGYARNRGRREHSAEVHAVLDAANTSNLVAAVALLLVLGRILDGSTREA
jgi:hypothetical protein